MDTAIEVPIELAVAAITRLRKVVELMGCTVTRVYPPEWRRGEVYVEVDVTHPKEPYGLQVSDHYTPDELA
jgi:hypothetical protein